MTRDLRKYARQTNTNLLVGLFVLVFILGEGLIYFFYGRGAAAMGLFCLLAALLPISLVVSFILLLNFVVKHANRD